MRLYCYLEEAMTRVDLPQANIMILHHFVWIGDRTRQLDGGHVEFCRGIEILLELNVSNSKPDEIAKICEVINPKNEKGKITLISRFGHKNVEKFLPKLIRGIKKRV